MTTGGPTNVEVLIFGGGAAGLWTLDKLVRCGHDALLLEANELGAGQTIASQGIVHGGLKYTLSGLLTPSARAIREMPLLWRRCLAGERDPNLSETRLRAPYCHLWQTTRLRSKVAMIGARAGLKVKPVVLTDDQKPDVLRSAPGAVARLEEQVIEPGSLLSSLAELHRGRLLKIDAHSGLEFECSQPGQIHAVKLINPETGDGLDLKPRRMIFTAGAGNGRLRQMAGLDRHAMQLRPLHMLLARGDLPTLNAHCVDGMKTRVTITSTRDFADRTVWQIGGQVSEDGVNMEPADLVSHAVRELGDTLPKLDLSGIDWATYRVDRAEAVAATGMRPDTYAVLPEGNTITAWPTKMALVPEMARIIAGMLPEPGSSPTSSEPQDWPRPNIAIPPWEEQEQWFTGV